MNLLQQIFDSPYTAKLGLVLLHSLWQIALVAIAVKLTLDATEGIGIRSSRIRYSVAYMGLLAICFLPVLTWAAVEAPAPVAPAPTALAQSPPSFVEPVSNIAEVPLPLLLELTDQLPPNPEAIQVEPAVEVVSSLNEQPVKQASIGSWVVCGWMLGMVFFAIRPLIGLRSASRLKTTGHQSVPDWVERTMGRLQEKIGLRKSVAIAQSALVAVPTVVGLIRPTIMLPLSCLTSLTADELDSILLHELAHIRRRDQLANLFQVLIETVFFFHPLVWWISWVVRIERENCCDDMAVKACGNSKTLVSALLSLEQSRGEKQRNLAGVMSSDGGSLVARVKRLIEPETRGRSPNHGAIASFLIAIGVTCFLASSVLFANSDPSSDESESEFDIVAMQIHRSLNDRHTVVEIEHLTDVCPSGTTRAEDPRTVHRLWNIATPELRNQTGRHIEGWKPDFLLHFLEAPDGTSPEKVTIQVKLGDSFQWSIGNGVWDMPSKWPLRYTLWDNDQPYDEESREQLFNETAYEHARVSLRENHKFRWVAIVDGRILASYDSFDKCVEAADEANRHASHRFIFRAGVDDIATDFAYSPWTTGNPSWWQIGRQFRIDHDITVSTDRWTTDGKTLGTNNGKATIGLGVPGTTKALLARPVVASGMIQQQLTITQYDSTELRLSRFAIPGSVNCQTYQADFKKVFVNVSIPELGIAHPVSAFVAPSEFVQKDPAKAEFRAALPSPDGELVGLRMLQPDPDLIRRVKFQTLADSGTIVITGDPMDTRRFRKVLEQVERRYRETGDKKNDDRPVSINESVPSSVDIALDGNTNGITLIGETDSINRLKRIIQDFASKSDPQTTPGIEVFKFQDSEFVEANDQINRLAEAGGKTKYGLIGELKIEIDAAKQSIVVVSTPQDLERIRKLLKNTEPPVIERLEYTQTFSPTIKVANRMNLMLLWKEYREKIGVDGPVEIRIEGGGAYIVLTGSISDVAKVRETIGEIIRTEARIDGNEAATSSKTQLENVDDLVEFVEEKMRLIPDHNSEWDDENAVYNQPWGERFKFLHRLVRSTDERVQKYVANNPDVSFRCDAYIRLLDAMKMTSREPGFLDPFDDSTWISQAIRCLAENIDHEGAFEKYKQLSWPTMVAKHSGVIVKASRKRETRAWACNKRLATAPTDLLEACKVADEDHGQSSQLVFDSLLEEVSQLLEIAFNELPDEPALNTGPTLKDTGLWCAECSAKYLERETGFDESRKNKVLALIQRMVEE